MSKLYWTISPVCTPIYFLIGNKTDKPVHAVTPDQGKTLKTKLKFEYFFEMCSLK